MFPGGGAPSEEASLPQPGPQTTADHDAEKEESGPQDIPQTPESGQQAQPREGMNFLCLWWGQAMPSPMVGLGRL